MRFTLPNPLGPPVTLDVESLQALRKSRFGLGGGVLGQRRLQVRALTVFVVLCFLYLVHPSPPFPPSYRVQYSVERNLEQQNVRLPFPEGKTGRFVHFDMPKGTGVNHQLQQVILQHHLAVLGNRSLAFQPYVADETFLPFVPYRWPWRSARIPLSAYIATVMSGFERFYSTPRAVTSKFYSRVCSRSREKVYTLKTAKTPTGDLELDPDGQARIHQIQMLLASDPHGCIRFTGEVFDDDFFDSQAPLDMIDTFIKSPVVEHFTFSPTVLGILNEMMPAIAPNSAKYDLAQIAKRRSKKPPKTGPMKHILAIHLRNGEGWQEACADKARRAAPFVAFNKLPKLPGNENVPPPAEMTEASRMGFYEAKCLPDVTRIIERARRLRKNHPFLRSVYILTDGPDSFTEDVRHWLASDAWDKVFVGKTDVYPSFEDREVGVAVDMEVARRAGVFVGNGILVIYVTEGPNDPMIQGIAPFTRPTAE